MAALFSLENIVDLAISVENVEKTKALLTPCNARQRGTIQIVKRFSFVSNNASALLNLIGNM